MPMHLNMGMRMWFEFAFLFLHLFDCAHLAENSELRMFPSPLTVNTQFQELPAEQFNEYNS